ncbi:unnamed protein product [Cunninghamella echinulata]
MAVDNGISINKQLPQFPDGPTAGLDSHYADQWSMEMLLNGWKRMDGDQSFSKIELAYKEKRRLLHGIHSIQVSHSQQSPPLNNVRYDENTIPSHYLDTSRNNNDTKILKPHLFQQHLPHHIFGTFYS